MKLFDKINAIAFKVDNFYRLIPIIKDFEVELFFNIETDRDASFDKNVDILVNKINKVKDIYLLKVKKSDYLPVTKYGHFIKTNGTHIKDVSLSYAVVNTDGVADIYRFKIEIDNKENQNDQH